MCYPITCKVCGKTTWAGCGQHVSDVRKRVPASQWCSGHSDAEQTAASSGGFLGRLFGRS